MRNKNEKKYKETLSKTEEKGVQPSSPPTPTKVPNN